MTSFPTAPVWFRPVLGLEEKLLKRFSGRLPTTAGLLGDGSDDVNLSQTELGIASAERMPIGNNSSPYLVQHVARYLWAMERCGGKRVLDFGSGEGYGTEILAWAATRATGLDISEGAITRSRDRWPTAQFDICDLSADSLPRADVGVCFEVLEHLKEPEPVLEAMVGSVGRLLFSVPNPLIGGTHINPHHHSDRTARQWKTMVREAAKESGLRALVSTYGQGIRSARVRPVQTMISGVWLFDVTLG